MKGIHPEDKCKCYCPPFRFDDFDLKYVGGDFRGGEVALLTCKSCGQLWLRYFIDYNHPLIKTGRWFRGEISAQGIASISASNAVKYLEKVDWYFYGGTYFNTLGEIGSGDLDLGI